MRHRVLIAFPTAWDRRQLEHCRELWQDRFELQFGEPDDASCRHDFDIVAHVADQIERWRGRIDGVFSSSDYPGATVAAAIADGLGLPGSPPAALLGTAHKLASRRVQQAAAPDATPGFADLDPDALVEPAFGFPCFVKPVKGSFSVLARRVDSAADLRAFLGSDAVREYRSYFLAIHQRLLRHFAPALPPGDHFLAEELLRGQLVTVEGFVTAQGIELLGIVDSVQHADHGSFVRFDLPSALPRASHERMADIARRIVPSLGLRHGMFNIEMIAEPGSDRLHVIEVNPRMCGQFADLYAKVDGSQNHGYLVALQLAVGERPILQHGRGPWGAAASVPLRTFAPVRVARAPDADDLARTMAAFADTLVWNECATGDALVDFVTGEDGRSYRYGVVNLGATAADELPRRAAAIERSLDYAFTPA